MDTDAFLRGLDSTARAGQWLEILAPFALMLVMLGLSVVLLLRRRRALAVACLVLAASPVFGGYWTRRDAAYERREQTADFRDRQALAARAAEVAAFPRTPLDGDYPPILEVHGTLPKKTIRQLLRDGVFEEVHIYEQYRRRPNDRVVHSFISAPDCREFGRGHEERPGADYRHRQRLLACFPALTERYVSVEAAPDAILYLVDGETTLGRPHGYHRGRLEIRVRRKGGDALVDYWEAPYVPRRSITRVEKARRLPQPIPQVDELSFIRRSVGPVDVTDAGSTAAVPS